MKRPLLITIVCVVLALLCALNLFSVAAAWGQVSGGRFAWIIATNLIAAASILLLRKMSRWGPVLYLGGQAVGIAAWLLWPMAGAENVYPLWALFVAPAIYAVCVLPFWRQLSPLKIGRA